MKTEVDMSIERKGYVPRFSLGSVFITPGARELLHDDLVMCLLRHLNGDWGDLSEEGQKENEMAVCFGHRLLSSYTDRFGTKFWVITEADRSATTILLPGEY